MIFNEFPLKMFFGLLSIICDYFILIVIPQFKISSIKNLIFFNMLK